MRIEIINTGSELMLGRVLNTHQQWLCRQLADLGYTVDRQTAVPDTGSAIQESVKEALTRSDLIITTGGLGPTSDDITRDLIAQLLSRPLHLNTTVLEHIAQYFTVRKRPQPESTKIQAQVPEGATVLMNAQGTAPGLVLETATGQCCSSGKSLLIMLPGPPRELRPMFSNQVVPILQKHFPTPLFICRTLKTTGIGESRVEEIIAPHLQRLVQEGLEIGYCARTGEVDVRFTATGDQAKSLVDQAAITVRKLISSHIYGEGDDQLETTVVKLLTDQKLKLVTAESCTGGYIANRITNVPGASLILWGGLVTYDNEAKVKLLGVSPDTLQKFGAVSEAIAREMAEGARQRYGADYAMSVTGIAGPGGGSLDKPVGTVFIALAGPRGTSVKSSLNQFDRETFKYVTSQQALEMLRQDLLKK